jgi:hypothetical protein
MQALLRASIKQPKLEAGVDPKSVVCEFFKQGLCDKGAPPRRPRATLWDSCAARARRVR